MAFYVVPESVITRFNKNQSPIGAIAFDLEGDENYYEIFGHAAHVFSDLVAGVDADALIKKVVSACDVDPKKYRLEFTKFIAQLVKYGLLKELEGKPRKKASPSKPLVEKGAPFSFGGVRKKKFKEHPAFFPVYGLSK